MTTHLDVFNALPDLLGDIPCVQFQPVTEVMWREMVLPPIESATGWRPVSVGAPVSDDPDDGFHMLVMFCPEILAATTADLPLSDDPLSDELQICDAPLTDGDEPDISVLLLADNYARIISWVLLNEILITEPGQEAVAHAKAIDLLDRHVSEGKVIPLALMLDKIMARALDGAAA